MAGQYGLTAAGACSPTGNANYRRLLYLANPAANAGGAYAGVDVVDDGAVAHYNGLIASAQHHLSHNYTFLANFHGF